MTLICQIPEVSLWYLSIMHISFHCTAADKSLQSCPTLCDPIDCSPPGSPAPGILQARTLEWVAIGLLQCMKMKSDSEVAQSCPTLSDHIDCSLPGSSVHRIFQERVLEWGAIAFSHCTIERHFLFTNFFTFPDIISRQSSSFSPNFLCICWSTNLSLS